jgi:hypothetical protein
MTADTFDRLWGTICNTAASIENDTGGRAAFQPSKKDDVYFNYNKFSRLCRHRHMDSGGKKLRKVAKDSPRIDRHKVASCVACAILQVRPMDIRRDEETARLAHFANETLAFLVALSVMKSFTKTIIEIKEGDARYKNDDGVDVSALSRTKTRVLQRIVDDGYVFPRIGNSDYLLWQIMAMSDIRLLDDYILSLSCILFLIEAHSLCSYEKQVVVAVQAAGAG